jgi:DNA-directed RNA polymerase specialized sigma24 family protein
MNSVTPVRIWISQLKEGDPVAAQQLWDIYFGRMVNAARLKLHGVPGRMADEEDVALSAFKSFCRGARDGRFLQVLEHEDPWPLLLALTTHKAVDLVRHERRIKRGGACRVSHQPDAPNGSPVEEDPLTEVVGREPDPRWTYETAEECQELLDRLSDTLLRAIALWRIEGFTTEEIAVKLGCASRTVERKMQLIRRLWKAEPPDD